MPNQLVLDKVVKDCDLGGENLNVIRVDATDDLFSEYINIDKINSMDERNGGSERSSIRNIAIGGNSSLDSSNVNLHPGDGVAKLHAMEKQIGELSYSDSINGETPENKVKIMDAEFSAAELKKIMESDKLAKIASTSPKRVKKIFANRQSAARSKEKKRQYTIELEHKVKILHTEVTSLTNQFYKLQRDNFELKNENNECKLRIQAMEQQCRLKDEANQQRRSSGFHHPRPESLHFLHAAGGLRSPPHLATLQHEAF